VLGDVLAYYHHFVSGAPEPEGKALPFSAYLDWLKKQDQKQALGYWKQLLAGVDAATPLPRVPGAANVPYAELALRLAPAQSERLAQQARAAGVTVNTLIQGAWALLLGRYAGSRDVVFGATVSGRSAELPGVESSAGLFINTLPVRVQLTPAVTVRRWLEALQRQNLESRRHEHTPLIEIRRQAGLSGDDGLFESVLVFDNTPVEKVLDQQPSGLAVAPLRGPSQGGEISETTGRNNYPLTLNVQPGAQLGLNLAYQCELFSRERILELGSQLGHLLDALAERLDAPLGELGLSVPALAPRAAFRTPPSILERFAEQVAKRPGAVAVQHEATTLTFAELDSAAERVAAGLRLRGVGHEDRIGLATDRSLEFVIGLLGILRAGAAYVPLDAKLPAGRVRELCQQAELRLVLAGPAALGTAQAAAAQTQTAGDGSAAADASRPAVLAITSLLQGAEPPHATRAPLVVHPAQAAYIIFTSGSTGKPKGVVVSHGALASYTCGLLERLGLDAGASMAMVSTVGADLGHTVLFGALCSGAALHLIGEERAFDPDAFADYMGRHEVGVLKIVPSHLQALLHARQPARVLPSRTLIVGGEASDWALVERVQALRPACRIINHYGPTETTVGVSTFALTAAADADVLQTLRAQSRTLPIGSALPNAELCVLDLDANRVPAGVAAELYIGGGRLARGYFGSPSLTAERFVPDASGSNPGGRMYRTGDRVKLGAGGALEFLGRMDRQVKIRGYRVELAEIEARLREHPSVREALVITRAAAAGGHAQLVAYAVPIAPEPAAFAALAQALAEHLARVLPDYMVPSRVIPLERLPLTENGKIDRKALPDPESSTVSGDAASDAASEVDPPSPVEQQLIEVWKEVLRVPAVRVTDNFFSLGGDSILSLQVIARARRRGLKVTPKQLFERQTIRDLASVVVVDPNAGKAPPANAAAAAPAPNVAKDVPLLPLQARFFGRDVPEPQRYNQALLLTPREALDAAALTAALQAVVDHHAALGLRFRRDAAGRWFQTTVPAAAEQERRQKDPLLWQRRADDDRGVEAIADAAQGSLNLESGPLLRAVLIDLAGREQRLFIAAHHLVVDGVSWRVLLEDLEAAYRKLRQRAPVELPPATSSSGEWAQALLGFARSEAATVEVDYWLEQVSGGEGLELPRDNPTGSLAARHLESVSVRLEPGATEELLKDAPEAYRTQVNDLLLCALARAVCRRTGKKSALIELEGHGREELGGHAGELDLSRSVGWFTSAFPVRLTPDLGQGGKAIGASIKAIKEQLRRVPLRGVGYAASRYLGEPAAVQRLAAAPEPRITFNYLGQFDQTFDDKALFVPAAEGMGASESPDAPLGNWLTVEGRVYRGALELSFGYSREVYRAESVEALARACQAELEALIKHCAGGASGVTPSDFPLAALDQARLDALGLLWNEVEDIYPLSPMQEGMLVHTLLEPGSGIYLMQHDHRIDAPIDLGLFRRAWELVAAQHHVLRTSFVWNDEGMRQVVRRHPDVAIEPFDWRALDPVAQEAELARVLEAELGQGFDMQRGPLWKVRLARTGEASYRFVFSNHHILMDAWGRAVLLQDVFSAYEALAQKVQPVLPERAPFRDFIAWLMQGEASPSALYWQNELAGFERATPLPNDRSLRRRMGVSVIGDVETFLSLEQTAELERLVGVNRLTLNTLVQAAWALTLVRTSGLREVLFGVTVAGRPVERPELEQTVGLFINSIPLRVRLPNARTLTRDWLGALLQQNAAIRQHEHLPLVEIQAGSDIARGQPLFDSLFVFENAPIDVELLESAEAMSASAIGGRTHTNYPITVVVYPGGRLGLHLSYDTRFFERATIEHLLGELERLLFAIASGLDAPFGSLPILPEGDRSRLLEDWNHTRADYPLSNGYVPLFEAQVKKTPERIAAACAGQRASYAELDADADRIAWSLRDAGVHPEGVVAILCERNLDLLRAVVGTLKAGAAYLPLDPRHPARRIGEILAQGRPAAILSTRPFDAVLSEALESLPDAERPRRLSLNDIERRERPRRKLESVLHTRSLAYVIYTSGSTGVPKGVAVEHGGMLNNQLGKIPLLGLSENDVIAQTASQCFDISVWQLLTGLLCGARVEMVPDAIVQDPSALVRHTRETGISVLELVPSVLQALLDDEQGALPACRVLLSTGEALPAELARTWLARTPDMRLYNAYGPAECSDDVAIGPVDADSLGRAPYAPIGRPTDNLRLYVLDTELELVPVGVTGELCVAGVGVGRGYQHDPARTAEVFLPNPFASAAGEPGERLYRTGDLARYRPDGTLEYVGRADHQVKIRGYRIELGEIEARLRGHADVRDAVVVASDGPTGKRLVAYVVASRQDSELVPALQQHLARHLPDYMLPSLIVTLAELPLSRNGKVDRKALPQPEWPEAEHYIEPRSELGKKLALIWQKALGVRRVGALDNFFELGGNSLTATQVIARIRRDLRLNVPLRHIFEADSLEGFEHAVVRDGYTLDGAPA
jgi:amino acid adenylation domain-containing protein/non-ribosomal peptide synthase protein (TIGR01720 family)